MEKASKCHKITSVATKALDNDLVVNGTGSHSQVLAPALLQLPAEGAARMGWDRQSETPIRHQTAASGPLCQRSGASSLNASHPTVLEMPPTSPFTLHAPLEAFLISPMKPCSPSCACPSIKDAQSPVVGALLRSTQHTSPLAPGQGQAVLSYLPSKAWASRAGSFLILLYVPAPRGGASTDSSQEKAGTLASVTELRP